MQAVLITPVQSLCNWSLWAFPLMWGLKALWAKGVVFDIWRSWSNVLCTKCVFLLLQTQALYLVKLFNIYIAFLFWGWVLMSTYSYFITVACILYDTQRWHFWALGRCSLLVSLIGYICNTCSPKGLHCVLKVKHWTDTLCEKCWSWVADCCPHALDLWQFAQFS